MCRLYRYRFILCSFGNQRNSIAFGLDRETIANFLGNAEPELTEGVGPPANMANITAYSFEFSFLTMSISE